MTHVAETQREHQTPESPDGYFPDRCFKTLFSFKFWVFSSFYIGIRRQKLDKRVKGKKGYGQVTAASEETRKEVRSRRSFLLTADLGLEATFETGAGLLLATASGLLAFALGALLVTTLAQVLFTLGLTLLLHARDGIEAFLPLSLRLLLRGLLALESLLQ